MPPAPQARRLRRPLRPAARAPPEPPAPRRPSAGVLPARHLEEGARRRAASGRCCCPALVAYVLDRQRASGPRRARRRALVAGSCTPTGAPTRARARPRDDPVFRVDPPAGGDHTEEVAKAGVYAGDDVPADGRLVHALEHGYVVLWHRPGVPTAGPRAGRARRTRATSSSRSGPRCRCPSRPPPGTAGCSAGRSSRRCWSASSTPTSARARRTSPAAEARATVSGCCPPARPRRATS